MSKSYIIFRCDKDDSTIVSVWDQERSVWLGVAECPDIETAKVVKDALEMREANKA